MSFMKIFSVPIIIVLMISALLPAESQAQPPKFKKPSFGKKPLFGSKTPSDNAAPAAFSATAGFKTSADRKTGVLEVSCDIPAGSHLFSVTQKKAVPGPLKTRIRVDDSNDFELTGKFQPDKDPHLKAIPGQAVKSEEHEGKVVFSAPVKFADAVDVDALTINVQLNGQVCTDAGSCIQIQEKLIASFAGVLDVIPAGAKFSPDSQHLLVSGVVVKIVDGAISDTPVQPGDKISIQLTAQPQDGYHVYARSTDLTKTGSATFLAITKSGGWRFSEPIADELPKVDSSSDPILRYYETPVTWKYETVIPRGFQGQSNTISGIMGVQTCTHENCDRPVSVGWKVEIPIGKKVSGAAVIFNDAGGIKAAIKAVEEEEKLRGSTLETSGTSSQGDAGEWAGSSLASVLPLAFLAGFILNFMPCVLPVIGLKVMSFVHQAGQNPRQIFLLNAMFCLGMISVFMVLAFFAVQSGLGWGQQFEGLTFKIIMIAVVVVFGLSFFGVWEIPLPGFGSGGSGLEQKEGLTGAFLKGILTTILATPCSGPMLIPAIVWAIAQPASVTYLVFLALGLGMGAPYLVIGVYPKLVSKLPKPGPWMETFKKIMGFIMLGTAVFLIGAIEHKYVVSVLTMLLILGFACWWMGRTSMAAPLPERMKSWAVSAAIGAFAVWFSFYFLISQHELDYQPFTRVTLEQHLAEGRTVFVDFTADW
jgi:thiol:disulfide interchange protein